MNLTELLKKKIPVVVILLFVIAAYGCLSLYAWLGSDGMMFYPHPSEYTNDGILKLKTKDGALISAFYLSDTQARFTLLLSHGNAEDIGDLREFLQALRSRGFSVMTYDYNGYGTSQGKPTERDCYRDIDAAYAYLTDVVKVPPDRIIAFGRSLGAAAAIDLASRKPVAGLIAESAFTSAFRVMTRVRILPFDKFDNLAKISRVYCPVLFIHGELDNTVPIWHGRKLYERANEPKHFYEIANAGHNDVAIKGSKQYFQQIIDFSNTLMHK